MSSNGTVSKDGSGSRYELNLKEAPPQAPPPGEVTVADLLRVLSRLQVHPSASGMTISLHQRELVALMTAVREAADRRIAAEIKKLDRVTAGARLARKLIASARAARTAARMAWAQCK